GWTFDGLPVKSNPSSLSSIWQTSIFDPIAGINTGRHPAASITALGYLSLTPWKARSLTVRRQVGMPTSGKRQGGIKLGLRAGAGGGRQRTDPGIQTTQGLMLLRTVHRRSQPLWSCAADRRSSIAAVPAAGS